MDLKEVMASRERIAELSDRRAEVVANAQGLLLAARATINLFNPTPDSDSEERPKYQETCWVVVHQVGQRVLCGCVDVKNYRDTGDGRGYELDGEVTISFIDGVLCEPTDKDEEARITITGAVFTGNEDESGGAFVSEHASLATLRDAFDVPIYSSNLRPEPLDSHEPKLATAEALLASMNTSLQTIVEGWNNTTLNPR